MMEQHLMDSGDKWKHHTMGKEKNTTQWAKWRHLLMGLVETSLDGQSGDNLEWDST